MLGEYKTKTNAGIGFGLVFQLAGYVVVRMPGDNATLLGWACLLAGIGIFCWGCCQYSKGKGHSQMWGLLVLPASLIPFANFIVLIILALLTDRHKQASASIQQATRLAQTPPPESKQQVHNPSHPANVQDRTRISFGPSKADPVPSDERGFYTIALAELKSNDLEKDAWAKAWKDANGVEGEAKRLYLEYRVQQLKLDYVSPPNLAKEMALTLRRGKGS